MKKIGLLEERWLGRAGDESAVMKDGWRCNGSKAMSWLSTGTAAQKGKASWALTHLTLLPSTLGSFRSCWKGKRQGANRGGKINGHGPKARGKSFSPLLKLIPLSSKANLRDWQRAARHGSPTDPAGVPAGFGVYSSTGFFARLYKHLPNRKAYKKMF